MRRLIISAGLELRTKFRAKDGTERFILDVPHAMERAREDPRRNWIKDSFITNKAQKAANLIITKYNDQPNSHREESYFVTIKTPYTDMATKRTGYVGFPLHWKDPSGDRFLMKFTPNNIGKLTTFIVREDREVRPKPRDIPIKLANVKFITLEIM